MRDVLRACHSGAPVTDFDFSESILERFVARARQLLTDQRRGASAGEVPSMLPTIVSSANGAARAIASASVSVSAPPWLLS
jgi:hypothetical protein